MANILLLEDDFKLATELKVFLEHKGHNCDIVYDGLVFFKQDSIARYDLYILDINVPSLNGIEVCKKIRENQNKTAILMLTAYGAVEDKVAALNYGADDYMVKPFHSDELLARIKALLRRGVAPQQETGMVYEISDLAIDIAEMKVTRNGREINLTPKEYKLLELLASAKGRPVSKQVIAEKLWDFQTGANTIEVYISFLRNKVDKGFRTSLIHTRPGYGYFLKEL